MKLVIFEIPNALRPPVLVVSGIGKFPFAMELVVEEVALVLLAVLPLK